MKVRDSGMPPETMWATFFDVDAILGKMQVNETVTVLMEVGCGYGTFTLNASRTIAGQLYAFDIEPEMIEHLEKKIAMENIKNIRLFNRDIIAHGSGLADESVDYVMLFNILHHDKPNELLSEAYRVLKKGGKVGIIHWRTDIETPRGPDLSIRPTPEQCVEWGRAAGFSVVKSPELLEPYHYGLIIEKS